MKRSKFTEEQIAYALREVEGGTAVGDVCRQLGVSLDNSSVMTVR
jgi:putative transposase